MVCCSEEIYQELNSISFNCCSPHSLQLLADEEKSFADNQHNQLPEPEEINTKVEDEDIEVVTLHDKFTSCSSSSRDERTFFDFSSEDVEKIRNVSFSHENYTGHVSLVVNLASF